MQKQREKAEEGWTRRDVEIFKEAKTDVRASAETEGTCRSILDNGTQVRA